MKKSAPWSRNDKLVVGGMAIALVACISGFFIPEVRRTIGLDKPATVQAPSARAQTPPTQSEGAPSQATPSTSEPTPPKSQPAQHKKTAENAVARTNGNNSPAVGDITQGPGSALSFGQKGGITASVVNVDTSRRLSQPEIAAIESEQNTCTTLPSITVTASNANQEAQRYAYDFIEALRGAGCKADLALPIPGLTPDVAGVHIGVRDYNDIGSSPRALGAILSRAQVTFSFAPMKPDFFPGESFVLVVGSKE